MKAKSIKILLSLFVCMFVIPMSPVSALEDEDLLNTVAVKEQHYETSEYGAIVNSLEKSYSKGARINSPEVTKILEKRKEYHDYIYKLKELSVNELAEMTFNDEQIYAIKNFDGSDEMATRASATVSATLKLKKFNYTASDNRTHASATFSGSWTGTPLFKQQDTIGIGMIGSLSRFVKKSSSNAITQYDGSVVRNTYGEYNSSAGQTYKFGICDANARIFKRFTMTYTADAGGKNTLMDYGAAYVHFYDRFNVSGLSIGVSGSGANIGISFNITKNGDFEWKKVYPQRSYI